MSANLPRMYADLAGWFHLLSAPEEYDYEAELYTRLLREASSTPPRTLLELGAGAGCMASHYKHQFTSTLVDLSAGMLAESQTINPECEHVEGDLRTVRLGRVFDVVFVHDAVMYMTTEADLLQAMITAFVHLRPGGVALFAPDCVRETFVPLTEHGGHDGPSRGLRYLEWDTDPDPSDNTFVVDFVYVLREDDQPLRVEHDRHLEGLFARANWLLLLGEAGFRATACTLETTEARESAGDVFIGVKPE